MNVGGEWWAYEDESGSTYYLNASTQETQWETPTPDQIGTAEGAAAPPAAPHDDGLPHGWEALIDEAGDHYYYHEATGSSQWDKPTDDAARAAAAYAAGDYTVAVSVEEYERAKNLLGWQVRSISYDRTVAISQLAELIERHVADVDVIFGFLFDEAISDAPALTMVMLTGFLTERAQGLSVSKELFLQLSLHSRLDKTGSGTVNKEEFIEGMKEVVVLPEGSPFRAWFLRELDCDYVPAAGEEPSLDSGAPAPADTWDVTYWKALASQLHDIWRSSRARLTDGSYEPRPKLVDGEWYDIANLTYAELPEHFKKSNQESAQCACNEVMNAVAAGRSLDAVFVEDASVVQHVNWMRVNGEWADPGLMVDYGELPEDEKEKDRVIVRKAVESWITLKSRYAEVVAWQEEVTAGSKSAYSSRRSTALPLSFAVNLDHEEKQAPALSAEEQNAAHAKAVKMSGAEAAKREQQAIFKSQWAHSLSGWAYKKQQRSNKFQKRWFVLEDGEVHYYGKKVEHDKGKPPSSSFSLAALKNVCNPSTTVSLSAAPRKAGAPFDLNFVERSLTMCAVSADEHVQTDSLIVRLSSLVANRGHMLTDKSGVALRILECTNCGALQGVTKSMQLKIKSGSIACARCRIRLPIKNAKSQHDINIHVVPCPLCNARNRYAEGRHHIDCAKCSHSILIPSQKRDDSSPVKLTTGADGIADGIEINRTQELEKRLRSQRESYYANQKRIAQLHQDIRRMKMLLLTNKPDAPAGAGSNSESPRKSST